MHSVKIAVVIPAHGVAGQIKKVILSLPSDIDHIIVVDDACPEGSGKVAAGVPLEKVTVVYHEKNLGVGGAVITGYKKAMEMGCDIIVKMDGDAQMDAGQIPRLVRPLIKGKADYTKGNRFRDFERLKTMPRVRLIGNSALSFLVKLASGYWDVMDPTNGFTAVQARTLKELNLEKIAKRYFFESDMLINLNIINAVVKDVDIPARYADEKSNMNIGKVLVQFPTKLLGGFLKRFFLKYYVYDFNMASVYVLLGLPMFLFGVIFGASTWIKNYAAGEPTPLGTIMLVALPIILALEMLLQAINIDINSIPKKE